MIAAFCIGEETQNFFAVSLSHNLRFTGVQERFLASLEMTIRGQPSTRRDERGCEIARPPISSSKAEPRDLNMIAAFCIGEETQNHFLPYRYLTIFALPVCKEDFSLRSKMTIRGNDGMRRSGILISRPRRLVANYFPLFLRTLLSCDIMTLLGENVFTKCRVSSTFMNP